MINSFKLEKVINRAREVGLDLSFCFLSLPAAAPVVSLHPVYLGSTVSVKITGYLIILHDPGYLI